MELNVRVDHALSGVVENAVSFETGVTMEQLRDAANVAYEHHGPEFTTDDRGALPDFFEDLILGRPMPPTFVTPSVQDVDTLTAMTLFLHRDLAIHPAVPGFVYQVDFVHRRGLPSLAHLDEPFARFLSALRRHFPESGLTQRQLSERILAAVGWIRDHLLNGTIPVLGPAPAEVRVLDQGTQGFTVAETHGSLWDGWVALYRLGFLRGVLFNQSEHSERRRMLIGRKSHFVEFDLNLAAALLNQVETAMGEPPEWTVSRDALWLESPPQTLILLRDVVEILTRV